MKTKTIKWLKELAVVKKNSKAEEVLEHINYLEAKVVNLEAELSRARDVVSCLQGR
ncbi:MAG: hypothetical protein ACJAS1_001645 [Oleiphilaceae bacterium]|jgi:hypothetical protein